jgi:hypothetical protein
MANLLSVTERYAYVRCAIPRETFDALSSWFGENIALQQLRLNWERGVRELASEVPPPNPSSRPDSPS